MRPRERASLLGAVVFGGGLLAAALSVAREAPWLYLSSIGLLSTGWVIVSVESVRALKALGVIGEGRRG